MRIAVDFTAGVRQPAGVGRYTRGLVRALATAADVDGEDHSLTLLWSGPKRIPLPENWPGVSTRRLPLDERWMTVALQRLRLPFPTDLYAGGADIFYSSDFALAPRWRAPGVVTIHDLSYVLLPDTHFPPLRRYLETTVPRSVRAASLVLADSEQTRRDVIEHLGADPAKVLTVLSAPDDVFKPATKESIEAVQAKWNVGGDYVISVGTIQPRKNLPVIFDALCRLPDSVRMVHVGRPGWLCDPIFEALERSGVNDRVTILSGVDDQDLAALYGGAVACVFPSLYEGFGLPCVEAMACGVPVIASHGGSLAEVVQDAGIIVDPFDSEAIAIGVKRLMEDREFRSDLIVRGHLQAASFRWEESGRKVLEAFRGIVGR